MGLESYNNTPMPEAEEFDEEKALLDIMTPKEREEELVRREKTRRQLILNDSPTLLGISEDEARKLVDERLSIAKDYMVNGADSLVEFLEKLRHEINTATTEEEKTNIRTKYLTQIKTANEYLTGLN